MVTAQGVDEVVVIKMMEVEVMATGFENALVVIGVVLLIANVVDGGVEALVEVVIVGMPVDEVIDPEEEEDVAEVAR